MKTFSIRLRLPRFAVLCCATILGGLFLALSGCKPPAKVKNEVTGKVTYKGTLVTGGTITFVSTTAGLGDLPCEIKADGTYVAVNVPTGAVKLVVETDSVKLIDDKQMEEAKKTMKPEDFKSWMANLEQNRKADGRTYVKIPKIYADKKQTPLTYTVQEGRQEHNIDLND